MENALDLEGVSARYPGSDALALQDVSLRVRAGEIAVLLGPNGAGKSTLLRVGAGFLPASSGRARVLGREVGEIERRSLARMVALVPQSEIVATGFRVREVAAMGRAPHQGGWMHESADDGVAVDDALERCDLVRLVDRRVETLSGGEQRRLAMARAIAQRPRILLLDEPAAFLDVRHSLQLHDLLADIAARYGIACVVAMHDLDAAARLGARVILLRGGSVVASGSPEEVMTAGRLREAFDAEIDVGIHQSSGRRYFVALRVSELER